MLASNRVAQDNPYQAPIADVGEPERSRFRSLRGLQGLLTPLLGLYAAMDVLVSVGAFITPTSDETADLTPADWVMSGALLLYGLVALITIITFGRFLVQSNVNARCFAPVPKFSPASMVWWHFVPIANLFKPYQAFQVVWHASGGSHDYSHKHPQMGLWWGSWIIVGILGNISWRLPDSASAVVALISAPITVACCYFAIVVTRALTERQEATALATYGAVSV